MLELSWDTRLSSSAVQLYCLDTTARTWSRLHSLAPPSGGQISFSIPTDLHSVSWEISAGGPSTIIAMIWLASLAARSLASCSERLFSLDEQNLENTSTPLTGSKTNNSLEGEMRTDRVLGDDGMLVLSVMILSSYGLGERLQTKSRYNMVASFRQVAAPAGEQLSSAATIFIRGTSDESLLGSPRFLTTTSAQESRRMILRRHVRVMGRRRSEF